MSDRTLHHDAGPVRVGDRYVLLGEVGRGGMATVHRAHDEVLDRIVAVKLLHAHLAHDPAFLERFRREARAAAALSHPNVVAVHDWGETADGAYLVLQLVEGLSLREVLRARGRLDAAETLAVLGPIAAGLGAAHDIGLVHRDVKPENLLIGRDGTVRITDFGLARAAASATSTFGADVLVGSPHYLSPEAVRGEPLDPRADVYALGVVLFECLTGRPPHEGDSPYSTAMAHLARAVPAPSSQVAGVPAPVDTLVTRATSMDATARFEDAAAFGRAFSAAVPGGARTVAVPPGTGDADPDDRDGPDDAGDLDDRTSGTGRLDDWTAILPAEEDHLPDPPPPPPGPGSTQHLSDVPAPPPPPAPDDRHRDAPFEPWEGTAGSVGDEHEDTAVVTGGRRRGRGWLVLLVLLALIGGSAAGGYLLWDRVLAPVTSIPSVQGADEAAAVEQLQRAGFDVRVAAERPHDLTIPDGSVLEQEPSGVARQGRTVTVILSGGPRPVEVADVAGSVEADAVQRLTDDGLDPVVVRAHDDEVPEGHVVASDPASGAIVDETSEVTLTVSDGPARTGVPDVRGTRVEEAEAALSDLGFDVQVERRGGFRALLSPGRVYDQDPAPGSTLAAGDTVILYAYE